MFTAAKVGSSRVFWRPPLPGILYVILASLLCTPQAADPVSLARESLPEAASPPEPMIAALVGDFGHEEADDSDNVQDTAKEMAAAASATAPDPVLPLATAPERAPPPPITPATAPDSIDVAEHISVATASDPALAGITPATAPDSAVSVTITPDAALQGQSVQLMRRTGTSAARASLIPDSGGLAGSEQDGGIPVAVREGNGTHEYAHRNDDKACGLGVAQAQFHERCECPTDTVAFCKGKCDQDIQCKGYVAAWAPLWQGCQFATVSSCPPQCSKHDKGNVGQITRGVGTDYGGCHVKSGVWADAYAVAPAGARCSSFTCGDGTVSDPKTQNVLCDRQCAADLCCKVIIMAETAECSAFQGCPNGVQSEKAVASCPDGVCTAELCCVHTLVHADKAAKKCGTFNAHLCGKNSQLDRSKLHLSCDDGGCTADVCCKEGPKCSSYHCGPKHFTDAAKAHRFCPEIDAVGICNHNLCCKDAPKCGHFNKCGEHHMPDPSKDDTHCPTGHCTPQICCFALPAHHRTPHHHHHKSHKVWHIVLVCVGVVGVLLLTGICAYVYKKKKGALFKKPVRAKAGAEPASAEAQPSSSD